MNLFTDHDFGAFADDGFGNLRRLNLKERLSAIDHFEWEEFYPTSNSKLVDGMIPARTQCPYAGKCEIKRAGACRHLGVNHEVTFHVQLREPSN